MDSSLSRQTVSSLSIIPGQTFTSLNGINQRGDIVGRYVDAAGIAHGFIARVRGTPSGNAMGKAGHSIQPAVDGRSTSTSRPRGGEV